MRKVLLLISPFLLLANEMSYTNNLSLDIRSVYINYDYDRGFDDAEAFVTSVKVKYEQALADGLTSGIAFATVQDLGILNDDSTKRNMSYIFDKHNENFSLLHQLYLKYSYSKSFIELGRFELETPLISSDDYFVLSNTFQGIHFGIKEVANYTFRAGYISDMSGAWDARYNGGSFNSMTKQAWAHRADHGADMYYQLVGNGTSPLGLGVKDAGLGYLGIEYKKDALKVQLYDHMLLDAYNSLFGQVDYTFKLDEKDLLLAGQYIEYDGIGALKNNPNPNAVVDYVTYSAKAQLSSKDWNVKLAYTGVTDTASIHFFGAHGGYPQFASGMMVTYFSTSLRDADIYSLTPSFSFGDNTHSFHLSTLYAYYDLNEAYTKNGIIGDAVHGDSFMHAYGVSGNYTYDEKLSWTIKLAQRVLEHGDQNILFRTILGYKF